MEPAPDHDAIWTWGEVSGLAADSPDRIIVAVWGDRNRQGEERPNGSNYLVVVNRNGDIIERWQQWDSILNKPHQVYISPYNPERHVWVVERGGGRNVPMSILKFTNDGKKLVMRLGDGSDPQNRAEARANPKPGPFDYGDPACLAFLPDGSFLLADGYWNSRIVKYNAKGEYVMEWGSLGTGPGQFDLVHGVAVDRDRRVYVADRTNNRVQVFTENGAFIEQWPDITDPVGVYIDETRCRVGRVRRVEPDTQIQPGRRAAVSLGRLRWHERWLCRWPVAAASDRRGSGRQCVYRELGRRLGHEIRSQARRRYRQARAKTPGSIEVITG